VIVKELKRCWHLPEVAHQNSGSCPLTYRTPILEQQQGASIEEFSGWNDKDVTALILASELEA
jgi:hypothetical protein